MEYCLQRTTAAAIVAAILLPELVEDTLVGYDGPDVGQAIYIDGKRHVIFEKIGTHVRSFPVEKLSD